jgi:hypothetical protein
MLYCTCRKHFPVTSAAFFSRSFIKAQDNKERSNCFNIFFKDASDAIYMFLEAQKVRQFSCSMSYSVNTKVLRRVKVKNEKCENHSRLYCTAYHFSNTEKWLACRVQIMETFFSRII